ncbi:hypothetical protein [Lyngbya aestuarii]
MHLQNINHQIIKEELIDVWGAEAVSYTWEYLQRNQHADYVVE